MIKSKINHSKEKQKTAQESTIKNYNNILLSSKKYKLQRDYWIKYLRDISAEQIIHSSKNFNGKENVSAAHKKIEYVLKPQLANTLIKLSKASDVTLYVVIVSAFLSFLHKYSGKEDLFIGLPVYRDRGNKSSLNHLVLLRKFITKDLAFKDILMDVREKFIEAIKNQDYPFEKIVEELQFITGNSYHFLFDLIVASENLHDLHSLGSHSYHLIVYFRHEENSFRIVFQYNSLCFDDAEIQRMTIYFSRLLEIAVHNLSIKQEEIDFLSAEEKKKLLDDFNDTASQYPMEKTIQKLFEEQVEKTPGHTALVFAGEELTYRDLDSQADRLARVLKEKGVAADTLVGIMVDHSLEMVVGVVAILKAGGAYLPIEPKNPTGRIAYIIKDSKIKILLTQRHLKDKVTFAGELIELNSLGTGYGEAGTEKDLGHASGSTSNSGSIAYVIYTSGSTGRPKGTLIEHQGLVNYVWWIRQLVKREDVFALYSSLAFDFTITSLFPPLVCGNKIIIYHDDGSEFIIDKILRDNEVTFLKLTPAHLLVLKDSDNRNSQLKTIFVGGEDLKVKLAADIYRSFGENLDIYNEYGPTETVVGCMLYKYDFAQDQEVSVPIGVPIHNMKIYNLDRCLNVLPVGRMGEIFIAGHGLARGYLNNPELTEERFVENPQQKNGRMYKTGDVARFLDESKMIYSNRIDHQVIVRGFRIELGEIENHLLNVPAIKEAVVVERKDKGGDCLCAYIVANREFKPNELSDYLRKQLPEYMIPSFYVNLKEIPLTSNGKVDRKALPEPSKRTTQYVPPRNPVEDKLQNIWSQVLELEKDYIGIYDDFFQLGGHSLKVSLLSSRTRAEFKIKLPMISFFNKTTISQQAKELAGAANVFPQPVDQYCEHIILLKKGSKRDVNFFFIHGGCGNIDVYIKLLDNLEFDFNYWGIKAEKLETFAPREIKLEEIARRYREMIKDIQPDGPYYIAGWSVGGAIAFEMVKQLEESGEKIEFLGLIDSYLLAEETGKPEFYTTESEKEILHTIFNSHQLILESLETTQMDKLWQQIVEEVEAVGMHPDEIITALPDDYRLTLPPGVTSIGDIVRNINMIRSYEHAILCYIPETKINTPIHYFKAIETKADKNRWEAFNENKIDYYTINSDHYSILRSSELATAFQEVINKAITNKNTMGEIRNKSGEKVMAKNS